MIEVEVEDAAWTTAEPQAEALVRRVAETVLLREDAGRGTVTVLLTGDDEVKDLNARFRRQAKPTNVLSFPAAENPEHLLGDLALAFGVCAREAQEQGKPLSHHLQHLVAHGVLHLLGYDHQREDEAEAMEAAEREVLAGLGIPDPYAAGEGDHD